jgi:secreted repeat protein with Y-X4-D motif
MRITALLALLAVSGVLAACGSGSSSSGSSSMSGAQPTVVTSAKKAKVGTVIVDAQGHPLYRYAGDRSKADANGEGVGGQWYVVKAASAG